MSEALNVFIIDEDSARPVLDVLRDWESAGLLEPFVWAPARNVEKSSGGSASALLVDIGGARLGSAQKRLADLGSPPVIRVCAVDRLIGPTVTATAGWLVEALRRTSPTTPFTLAHVLLAEIGMPAEAPFVATGGWHNIVLAPEQSASPADASQPLHAEDDELTLAMHHAAGLAGLMGLWSFAPGSPLDDRPTLPGEQARLARTFFRHRDARRAEMQLRNHVLAVGDPLPQPFAQGDPVAYIEDSGAAAGEAARTFFEVHRLGPKDRVSPSSKDPERLSLWESIRRLFAFIGAALKGAPRELVHRQLDGAARRLAVAGQRFANGDNSALQTIVRGRLGDGSLATGRQSSQALAKYSDSIGASGYREDHASHVKVWRDFMGIGLTLADAGTRGSSVPAPQVLNRPAVLRSARSIAPSPAEAFRGLPPNVAAQLQEDCILPADLERTRAVLAKLQDDASYAGMEWGRAQHDLVNWRDSTQRPSYSGQVGLLLTAALEQLREEVQRYSDQIRRLSQPQDDSGFVERQAKRARMMRWALIGAVAVLVGLGVARWQEWLTWSDVLGYGAGALLVASIVIVIVYSLGQRDLYQLLNRRGIDLSEAEAAARNLDLALGDLARVSALYGQYLHWATVLGAFLHEPFGPRQPVTDQFQILGGELPRSLQVGVVEASDVAIDATARDVRSRLLQTTWLDDPYHALLRDAWMLCGRAGDEVRANPDRLFEDLARSEDSALSQFTSSLVRSGIPQRTGDDFWARARTVLISMPEARQAFLAGVTWAGEAGRRTPTFSLAESSSRARPFDHSSFIAEHMSGHELTVDVSATVLVNPGAGLSETESLTEFSHPFAWQVLRFGPPGTDTTDGGPEAPAPIL